MKNVTLTEQQNKVISEALGKRLQLPSYLLSGITNRQTPLSNCKAAQNYQTLLDLAAKRYAEIKSNFTDDITEYPIEKVYAKLSTLSNMCINKEKIIKKQLEEICVNGIIEYFNVPEDGVDISCELVNEIPSRTQFHITPDTDEDFRYEDYESMENEDADTQKRLMLNTLIVGGAMRVSWEILRKNFEKIFDLDEELPHVYSEIMKINEYLVFSQNVNISDNNHKQGGYVEVTLGNDITDTKIEARAVICPILLLELVRGCMELWISNGLPDDIDTAKSVINKADALENDPWYMRFGPIIWDRLFNLRKRELKHLPSFLTIVSTLPNDTFVSLFQEIVSNTKKGEDLAEKLYKEAEYDDEYSNFEYDIKQKQSERGIIEDDYFSDDEIAEWENNEC